MKWIFQFVVENAWILYLGGVLSAYGHQWYNSDFWIIIIPIAILYSFFGKSK
jgi:hypothetical protein